MVAYQSLDLVIRQGNGWRKLHFITPHPIRLGYRVHPPPQPTAWREILSRRDGANSGSSVNIYQSTLPHAPGAVLNPQLRQIFEQDPSTEKTLNVERPVITEENPRESLVVVERGPNVDTMERDRPWHRKLYEKLNARGRAGSTMTWAEIRSKCRVICEHGIEED